MEFTLIVHGRRNNYKVKPLVCNNSVNDKVVFFIIDKLSNFKQHKNQICIVVPFDMKEIH